jgi:hypothetical protein
MCLLIEEAVDILKNDQDGKSHQIVRITPLLT